MCVNVWNLQDGRHENDSSYECHIVSVPASSTTINFRAYHLILGFWPVVFCMIYTSLEHENCVCNSVVACISGAPCAQACMRAPYFGSKDIARKGQGFVWMAAAVLLACKKAAMWICGVAQKHELHVVLLSSKCAAP